MTDQRTTQIWEVKSTGDAEQPSQVLSKLSSHQNQSTDTTEGTATGKACVGTGKMYRKLTQKKFAGGESQKSNHCAPSAKNSPPSHINALSQKINNGWFMFNLQSNTQLAEKEKVINIENTL